MKKIVLIIVSCIMLQIQALPSLEQVKNATRISARYLPLVLSGIATSGKIILSLQQQSRYIKMQSDLRHWRDEGFSKETDKNKEKRDNFMKSSAYIDINNYIKKNYADENTTLDELEEEHIKKVIKRLNQDLTDINREFHPFLNLTQIALLGYLVYNFSGSHPWIGKLPGLCFSANALDHALFSGCKCGKYLHIFWPLLGAACALVA